MSNIKPIGLVRQSQAVTTFSVGAILDFDSGSYMPLGLEFWPQLVSQRVGTKLFDERLSKLLGKSYFVIPPAKRSVGTYANAPVNSAYALPVVRFPEWHFCSNPECHRLGVAGRPFIFDPTTQRLKCVVHGAPVTPVRFVVSCDRGHIEDFPWAGWVHEGKTCSNHKLFLRSTGESLSLADLNVFCSTCNSSRSMEGAFRGELSTFPCNGKRIWLQDEVSCGKYLSILQRGSSSAHFQVSESALSIPPVSDTVSQELDNVMTALDSLPESSREIFLKSFSKEKGIPYKDMLSAYKRRKNSQTTTTEPVSHVTMRQEEYRALCSDVFEPSPVPGRIPYFENKISHPNKIIHKFIDLVGAVSRLREVRVLRGFTRINPLQVKGSESAENLATLSNAELDWLPAMEIRGEGIFIRLNIDSVRKWISENPSVSNRADLINSHFVNLQANRGVQPDHIITPQRLLIHTLAHLFIRQISVDCGYPSASIRERIYCSDELNSDEAMCGFLIYTGTSDSSGSLGGLVSLANLDRFAGVLTRTIESAQWCGSDPVCIESNPDQNGDRVVGAACHSCAILPETSCECGNLELDRLVLIGSDKFSGYFKNYGT